MKTDLDPDMRKFMEAPAEERIHLAQNLFKICVKLLEGTPFEILPCSVCPARPLQTREQSPELLRQ